MDILLDDLWYSYQLEKNAYTTPEEQLLLMRIVQAGDLLHGELNTEQKAMLEKYLDLQGQLDNLCEKKAYITGIRFAMRLCTETLLQNGEGNLNTIIKE